MGTLSLGPSRAQLEDAARFILLNAAEVSVALGKPEYSGGNIQLFRDFRDNLRVISAAQLVMIGTKYRLEPSQVVNRMEGVIQNGKPPSGSELAMLMEYCDQVRCAFGFRREFPSA